MDQLELMDQLEKRELAIESQDPDLLDILGSDDNPWIRWHVAHNSNTLPSTLARLCYEDKEVFVINGALANSNVPVSVIEYFSQLDEKTLDSGFLLSIFTNPVTPEHVIWSLVNKLYLSNRGYAALRLSVHEDINLYARSCILMRQMLDNWDSSLDDTDEDDENE